MGSAKHSIMIGVSAIRNIMNWRLPIPMTSLLLLSFLLVLSGPALEGCQSASVGDTSGAKPPEASEEHESNRIYKNAGKLSDKGHGHFHEYEDVHDVGDGDHRDRPEEGYEYDHEAFLGDEAHEFDDLDPEESKRRLSVIVDKIDNDGDGLVTLEEMRNWIKFTHDRYTSEDVERQWVQHNQEGKDALGWDEYRQLVYGFLDDTSDDNEVSEEDNESYRKMEVRDRRRWGLADENGDGSLTKLEFKHFLHPEEVDHMKDLVVQETIDDIDKDGDGKLSLEEYIGDMYHHDEEDGPEGEEPEWVKRERESFNEVRDTNNDGFMDNNEVRTWILPQDFDHVEAEAKHLIHESDSDSDEMLTKDEILSKYDLFVGSQATDFGEALTRHDEF